MFHAMPPPSPFFFFLDVLKCPCTSVFARHRLTVLLPNHPLLYSCLLHKINHPNTFNLRPCYVNPNVDIIFALPLDAKTTTYSSAPHLHSRNVNSPPASLLLGFPKLISSPACHPVYAWSDVRCICVRTGASQNRVPWKCIHPHKTCSGKDTAA